MVPTNNNAPAKITRFEKFMLLPPTGSSIDDRLSFRHALSVICPPHEAALADPISELPARNLSLVGASNFRDLGGYPTRDGRIVRWRQIFRSNHLGRLTEDDIAMVRSLGVRSAFDFRGMEERNQALCSIADIAVHSLPVEPTVVESLRAIAASGTKLSTQHAIEVMRDSYRGYVQDNTPRFRTLFAHLVADHAPLVIH